MPRIREIKVSYEEKEVTDPRVEEPIRSVDAVLRLTSFLRCAVDEEVYALVLGADSKLIGLYQLAKGGRHETLLDPASLYRTVLMVEGTSVVLVHNHPQCGVRPSPEDIRTTGQILLVGFALHVPLLDHIIVCGHESYSFATAGLLAWLQAKELKALGMKGIRDVRDPRETEAEARAAIAALGEKEAAGATPATEAAEGRMPLQVQQEADDDG
jgi:DNA repair protein RadC